MQDLLSQLRAYLDNHRADISEDTFSDLGVFLAALHNGVLKLEATFEVVADCFEGTALSVNSSLMKMKQQMRVNPSGVHAQHMQVNLAQRGGSSVAGPDSTGTSSAAGAAAAAGNAQLQSVTLNSVSVYEESLVDLSNWFVSSALHFATLPQPTICRTTKPSGKAATVRHPAGVMQGILEFSEKAEQNALEALNGNLHAT